MRDRVCSVLLHSGHVQSAHDKITNLRELKFKDSKRRRKTLPPCDSIFQTFVQTNSQREFGAVISYNPPLNSDEYPNRAILEVSVDGRAVEIWNINAGETLLLEDGCSNKVLERLVFSRKDKENALASLSNEYFGFIDFTFWRAMHDSDHDSDLFPDEGLPALAIMTFHYRDCRWLKSRGVLKEEPKSNIEIRKPLDEPLMHQEVKTESQNTDNPFSGPVNRKRVPVYVNDMNGFCHTKMSVNIDTNADLSILFQSIEQILKHLEQTDQTDSVTVEAITKEGIRTRDFLTLDIESIDSLHVI